MRRPRLTARGPRLSTEQTTPSTGTLTVKRGMADMLKGGVIMDVVTPEQHRIDQDA